MPQPRRTSSTQQKKKEPTLRERVETLRGEITSLREDAVNAGDTEAANVLKAAERQFNVAPFTPVV
jgi:hypothetical protein